MNHFQSMMLICRHPAYVSSSHIKESFQRAGMGLVDTGAASIVTPAGLVSGSGGRGMRRALEDMEM